MAVVGDSSLWADTFPDHLIPDILDLVWSAWQTFSKPTLNDLEVSITKRFRSSLRQQRHLVKLPVLIDREIPEDDLQSGEEKGRIDIRFTSYERCNEDIYFAFECKRLNIINRKGKRESLAGKYIAEGMMRFITFKYASNIFQGGMIGYVMNGDSVTAINAVNTQIRRRCKELRISPQSGLSKSSLIPENLQIKETQHHRNVTLFTLHHIFLATV